MATLRDNVLKVFVGGTHMILLILIFFLPFVRTVYTRVAYELQFAYSLPGSRGGEPLHIINFILILICIYILYLVNLT